MVSFRRKLVAGLPWHLRKSLSEAYKNWKFRKPPFAPSRYLTYESFPTRPSATEDEQALEGRCGVVAALQGDVDPLSQLNRFHRNHDLLGFCAAMRRAQTDSPVSILDFGGGAGIDYALMKHAIGSQKIDYTVIEFEPVCQVGREVWADDGGIQFVTDIDHATGDYDIVYAWGAVHYMPDPVDFIRQLAEKARYAVLILGSNFAQQPFLRAQQNQSVPYPQWVISLPDTERVMKQAGFNLAFRANGADEYNVDNFQPGQQVGRSACLLFLRE